MTNNYLSHNFKYLIKVSLDNKNKFNENKPFPHIIFDNFFNTKYLDLILQKDLQTLPAMEAHTICPE